MSSITSGTDSADNSPQKGSGLVPVDGANSNDEMQDINVSPVGEQRKKVTDGIDDVDALLNELSTPGVDGTTVDSTNTNSNEDPWDLLSSSNQPTETHYEDNTESLKRLKESSTRLTAAIGSATHDLDQKFGLSASVRDIDSSYNVTDGLKSGAASITNLWSSLNLGQKTKIVASSISETVKPLASTVEENVRPIQTGIVNRAEEMKISEHLADAERGVRDFDREHGISSRTAGLLATGADYLAKSIAPDDTWVSDETRGAAVVDSTTNELQMTTERKEEQEEEEDESTEGKTGLTPDYVVPAKVTEAKNSTKDAVEGKDGEGFPSSFRK